MKKTVFMFCILMAACFTSIFSQDNKYVGHWMLEASGLPYGDGKMEMTITSESGYLKQGESNVRFSRLDINGDKLEGEYEVMGFKVSLDLVIQEDGTAKGSIMGMFDLKALKTSESIKPNDMITTENTFSKVNLKDISGVWYGLYAGSPLIFTVNEDMIKIESEAFSSLNMESPFLFEEGSPGRITLQETQPGMEGKGICAIENGQMEILMIFGATGQVNYPESFSDGLINPAASRFSLIRDSSIIDDAVAAAEIPKKATLAFERNRILGAGVNMNAVVDGLFGDKPLKDGTIKAIARAGFKSVRLPIRWADHTTKRKPYSIDSKFFNKVDAIVDECLSEGLAVILDNHYYPAVSYGNEATGMSFSENLERIYYIWEQLSSHYKNYSDESLFFELMNEPGLMLSPDLWNEIVASCIRIIRHDNPERTVIVSTPSLGQHWTIGLLNFPDDEWNIIVDAHYYLPQTFTHQGLEYALAGDQHNIQWRGSEQDKQPLDHDFAFLARWSSRTGRPVNIGEYGVNNNADQTSRFRYLQYLRSLIIKYGFSSNIWALHRDVFSIYDENTGEWNTEVLKALNLKEQ